MWGVLGPGGERERLVLPAVLDHRGNQGQFRIPPDGRRVEFRFDVWDGGKFSSSLARFDLASRILETAVQPAAGLA